MSISTLVLFPAYCFARASSAAVSHDVNFNLNLGDELFTNMVNSSRRRVVVALHSCRAAAPYVAVDTVCADAKFIHSCGTGVVQMIAYKIQW